jgi:hypothetical protein
MSSTTLSAYDDLSHLPSFEDDPLHTPAPYDTALANELLVLEPQSLGVLGQI